MRQRGEQVDLARGESEQIEFPRRGLEADEEDPPPTTRCPQRGRRRVRGAGRLDYDGGPLTVRGGLNRRGEIGARYVDRQIRPEPARRLEPLVIDVDGDDGRGALGGRAGHDESANAAY